MLILQNPDSLLLPSRPPWWVTCSILAFPLPTSSTALLNLLLTLKTHQCLGTLRASVFLIPSTKSIGPDFHRAVLCSTTNLSSAITISETFSWIFPSLSIAPYGHRLHRIRPLHGYTVIFPLVSCLSFCQYIVPLRLNLVFHLWSKSQIPY